MRQRPTGGQRSNRLEHRLCALNDETCRAVLAALDGPQTGRELGVQVDCATSTLYRKLDLLERAELVERSNVIGENFAHTSTYHRTFDRLTITMEDILAMNDHG